MNPLPTRAAIQAHDNRADAILRNTLGARKVGPGRRAAGWVNLLAPVDGPTAERKP